MGLMDTIDWEVVPDIEIAGRVLDVEGTFWSEFTKEGHEMQPMIAPCIIGVASRGWVGVRLNHAMFLLNARRFCKILSRMGWHRNADCVKF